MSEWEYGKPPNEELVEVEADGLLRVRAIWGRDGYRPHWESEDKDTLWAPNTFDKWRRINVAACPHPDCVVVREGTNEEKG